MKGIILRGGEYQKKFMGSFNQIANLIRSSPKIVILTGAGISTESGLPDFRSEGGFWTKKSTYSVSRLCKE